MKKLIFIILITCMLIPQAGYSMEAELAVLKAKVNNLPKGSLPRAAIEKKIQAIEAQLQSGGAQPASEAAEPDAAALKAAKEAAIRKEAARLKAEKEAKEEKEKSPRGPGAEEKRQNEINRLAEEISSLLVNIHNTVKGTVNDTLIDSFVMNIQEGVMLNH